MDQIHHRCGEASSLGQRGTGGHEGEELEGYWRKTALKLSREISHVKVELKTNVSDICCVTIIRFDVEN
jgi:hypothetical protein